MAEAPAVVFKPSLKYPDHFNPSHRSKAADIGIGISITLTFILVVGVIVYCYVKSRRQRQRQRQLQEIHLVEVAAALPRRIYHAPVEEDRLDCSICLEEYEDGEELVELPGCLHLFHSGCIGNALENKRECPLCRAQLA